MSDTRRWPDEDSNDGEKQPLFIDDQYPGLVYSVNHHFPAPSEGMVVAVNRNSTEPSSPQLTTSTTYVFNTLRSGVNGLSNYIRGAQESGASCVAEILCGGVGIGLAAPCGPAPAVATGLILGTLAGIFVPAAISTQCSSSPSNHTPEREKNVGIADGIEMTRK